MINIKIKYFSLLAVIPLFTTGLDATPFTVTYTVAAKPIPQETKIFYNLLFSKISY